MLRLSETLQMYRAAYTSQVGHVQGLVRSKLSRTCLKGVDVHDVLDRCSRRPRLDNENVIVTVSPDETYTVRLGSKGRVVVAYWDSLHAADALTAAACTIGAQHSPDDAVLHLHMTLEADSAGRRTKAREDVGAAVTTMRAAIMGRSKRSAVAL